MINMSIFKLYIESRVKLNPLYIKPTTYFDLYSKNG